MKKKILKVVSVLSALLVVSILPLVASKMVHPSLSILVTAILIAVCLHFGEKIKELIIKLLAKI